jgi:hypothetical protein
MDERHRIISNEFVCFVGRCLAVHSILVHVLSRQTALKWKNQIEALSDDRNRCALDPDDILAPHKVIHHYPEQFLLQTQIFAVQWMGERCGGRWGLLTLPDYLKLDFSS